MFIWDDAEQNIPEESIRLCIVCRVNVHHTLQSKLLRDSPENTNQFTTGCVDQPIEAGGVDDSAPREFRIKQSILIAHNTADAIEP
ncbi:hypothetical protein TNCV_1172751 [Trichonephila clavipes]|uniref:Uncharacterized protein n=1 Tax=Trichonephila clavipes TaxID=2585209 RepID=A0A8X6RWU1_TRICX|nr:hypothetical protein TNCV_1172751 [Trichonephila clavipes]